MSLYTVMLLRACVFVSSPQVGTVSAAFTPVSDEALHHIIQFYEYDTDLPLNARVIAAMGTSKYRREKIVFRSPHQGDVPAYLGIPHTGPGPFPFVILIHGIGGSKEDWWVRNNFVHGESLTLKLLAGGIGVLTMDAEFHGERIAGNDYESPDTIVFEHGRPSRLRNMMVQSTVECRRGIDYLATRQEVDMERIGVIGYSMGGMMVFPLMAVDDRIKAGVACVAPLGTEPMFNSTKLSASRAERIAGVAPYNFARKIKNQALCVLAGRRDPLYVDREVRELLEQVPSTHKEVIFYDSGHRLPQQYVDDAAGWVERYLLTGD